MDIDIQDVYLQKVEKPEDQYVNEVIRDFYICCLSREASLLGRKEVLTGKAKFGILGDGKEVPQVAMARAFAKGDWRAGYYRDQTFMMALGLCSIEEYFAQLYADPVHDVFSGGRQMNAHFSSRTIRQNGEWEDLTDLYNISSDISSTGGQMARGFGLAFASKKFRALDLKTSTLSKDGNEVCFITIGDASTSEGIFWETINAAVVEQVPMVVSVWDDGYGISVPKHLQTAKSSISKALRGFLKEDDKDGMHIFVAKAYDYAGLVDMYDRGVSLSRKTHAPVLFHIEDCTQPQGHSTSGSHERYKSKERLKWEQDFDCINRMAQWMISCGIANEEQVQALREKAKIEAKKGKDAAWEKAQKRAVEAKSYLASELLKAKEVGTLDQLVDELQNELRMQVTPSLAEAVALTRRLYYYLRSVGNVQADSIKSWLNAVYDSAYEDYHTNLMSSSPLAAIRSNVELPEYTENPEKIPGYKILNEFFDSKMAENPFILAFGEDVGQIGDVNQGFAGLQEKYGKDRVFDTGIREWSIMGQAIGTAMRGFRPIAEIQYLDYLIYGLQPLTDDLATLRYRSDGLQCAPAIIRTRGHRLEGIWHAGSPLGMILNSLRGMYVCVPRNMVQAAGMYNTLLKSDDPAIVIEPLNGYRIRENRPENLTTFSIPLGLPEVLMTGSDITLVTYGSCVRIAEAAIKLLQQFDVFVELIDVQTLLPFDLEQVIVNSIKKTNRILFLDEDVPGGATAYMMREVLEVQKGYHFLDSAPHTLTAREHRPPFGSEGDYFSKPNIEDVVEKILGIMREVHPDGYPAL